MEFLALLIGAGVVAASPLVPGLRPVAKGAVAGSLLVADKTKAVVAIAGEHWMDLIAEAQVERAAGSGGACLHCRDHYDSPE